MIKFVENKLIDMSSLAALMAQTIELNHHTNFGPLSKLLEHELSILNKLEPNFQTLVGANATSLIVALVSALNNIHNRSLRWVCSDFGFLTNFLGPMTNQQHLECNKMGMLDLEKLRHVDPSSYDIIFVTNVFGLSCDFDKYFDFAQTRNKILIIDNAAGFQSLSPYHAAAAHRWPDLEWAEVVSFHHTKPWGMGEGGAVFAPKSWMPNLRASINFGVGPDGTVLHDRRWCLNGKISDLACAQILQRIRNHMTWTPLYKRQYTRILKLGLQVGLTPLTWVNLYTTTPGQIAFVTRNPISVGEFPQSDFCLMKYYRPIDSLCSSMSKNLYRRMVNVPVHSQMGELADASILRVFNRIKSLDEQKTRALSSRSCQRNIQKTGDEYQHEISSCVVSTVPNSHQRLNKKVLPQQYPDL